MNLSASPHARPFRLIKPRALLGVAAFLLATAMTARCQGPPPGAVAAFQAFCQRVEPGPPGLHAEGRFRVTDPEGEPVLERLPIPAGSVPDGAMLHGWRATAFFPGATSAGLRQVLHDLPAYPRVFAPDVLSARVLLNTPDHQETTLRIRQKHVLTVVLDTTYDIRFGQPGPAHGSLASGAMAFGTMTSRSGRVMEIADAGTPEEHALPPGEEHGFLWAQNTYWTWAEQPGGLRVEVLSVSLTRAIPTGLGWAVRPLVESVPRESLRFTLERIAAALAASPGHTSQIPNRTSQLDRANQERTHP